MRKAKRTIIKTTPTYAIVVDGETEVWYLQMLKRNERNIRVSIKPEIPNKKSLEDQYNLVRDLSTKEYTKVFWIIDLDTLVKEQGELSKGKQSPLKTLAEYRQHLSHKYPNVIVIVNNPCIEFWFLLHFEKTTKYFKACSNAEAQLRRYLLNYEKTQKYFTKQNDDIYLKLKPHLKIAIKNAISLGNYDDDYAIKAMSEMELLFLAEELKKHFE